MSTTRLVIPSAALRSSGACLQTAIAGPLKLATFVNHVDADAPNLLSVDALTGKPVQLGFKTRTFDLEAGRTFVIGSHHILTNGTRRVTVPVHGAQDLKITTLKSIEKQAGVLLT